MNPQTLRQALETAVKSLFASQPDIFNLTPESGQTEWNLTTHLAGEISKLLPLFAYDIDLRKPDAGGRRPDIVFHKRGTHLDNFLVIEVKRDNHQALAEEWIKIQQYWFAEPYLYQFGAVINLNSDQTYQLEVSMNPVNPKDIAG